MARSRRVGSSDSNNNTHFFKVLMPGYTQKLNIPKAYTRNLRGGDINREHAVLSSRKGKSWRVKVRRLTGECLCFEEGWEDFVKDHDLRLGDLLVFEHKGAMVFNVLLFGPSACEKHYNSSTETPVPVPVPVATKHRKPKEEGGQSPIEAAEAYASRHPHFFASICADHLIGRRPIHVPIQFARGYGLCNMRRKVTLRDPQKSLYRVNMSYRSSSSRIRVSLGKGIIKFLNAHDVQVGDVCIMELDVLERKKNKIVFDVLVFKG